MAYIQDYDDNKITKTQVAHELIAFAAAVGFGFIALMLLGSGNNGMQIGGMVFYGVAVMALLYLRFAAETVLGEALSRLIWLMGFGAFTCLLFLFVPGVLGFAISIGSGDPSVAFSFGGIFVMLGLPALAILPRS